MTNKNKEPFQIFIKFTNTVTIDGMKNKDTVKTLKGKIQDKEGYLMEEMRLIYGGKQLRDELTMEDYGIVKESTIHVALRLLGGTELVKVCETQCKKRGISVVSQPCQVNYCACEQNTCTGSDYKRVKLPTCKCNNCYVCAVCLLTHYNNCKKNGDSIYCPVNKKKCPDLRLDDMFAVFGYSKEKIKNEYLFWDKIYMKKNPEISQCPTCTQFGFRDKSVKISRVRCGSKKCNGKDYCVWCGKLWNNSSNDNNYCGHNDCKSSPQTLTNILNCGTKKISGIDNVPKTRLCPICKIFIEHSDKCKHMTCKMCKHEFCFACLIKWHDCHCERCLGGKGNGCNLNKKCSAAPTQNIND